MDKNLYKSYTNILFSKNSFYRGIMRTFDIFGFVNKYNFSNTPEEADSKALYSDWLTVGNDIRNTIDKVKNEKK